VKKTHFSIEPLEGQVFEGFTMGDRWNGWACPFFTKEEGHQLVRAWNAAGCQADYDPLSDLFRFALLDEIGNPTPNLGDEEAAERFGPVMIDGMTLYPIGAGAWIWDESQPGNIPEQISQQI